MSAVRIVVRVIALAKCVMVAIRVREKCFMHRKEKLVQFMTVLEIISVCKIVVNVVKCLVRYGLIPEIRSFQMKNLTKM